MNLDVYMDSVFDKYHKMEDPSGYFAWETVQSSFRFRRDEMICDGDLQELDTKSSLIHSTKYYAATPRALFQFAVPSS